MNPEIFSIGNFSIRWYSVLILVGIVIGFILALREGKKFNLPEDFIFNLGFWVVVFIYIGIIL